MNGLEDWLGFLFNLRLLDEYGWRLWAGLKITAQIVSVSVVLGFFLGYGICRARLSRHVWLSAPAYAYITVLRGTPLLCQLYLVYYGAGEMRWAFETIGLWWFFREALACCLFVFTLNTAAYQAEVLRGALMSVPRGQIEAARSLGLSPYRIDRHIVWPQAAMVALRPLGNELIALIKASALAALVTLLDLMGQTRLVFSRTFDFSVYLYSALIYLVIVECIRRLWNVAERRLTRHLARA